MLDRLVAENPARQAPRAWLLRGKLAAREAEHEVAVRVLSPLVADPALKAEVEPLLAQSRLELRERELRWQNLATTEARVAAQAREPAEAARGPAEATPVEGDAGGAGTKPPSIPGAQPAADRSPGAKVGNYSGSIGRHGRASFVVRGLRPGGAYVFLATGSCSRREKAVEETDRFGSTSYYRRKLADGPVNGLDFRVQFGDPPSRAVAVAQKHGLDQNRVAFVAGRPMRVAVFDESSTGEDVDCVVTGFAVEAE